MLNMLEMIYEIVVMIAGALRRMWQRVMGRIFPRPVPVRVRRYFLAPVSVEHRGTDGFENGRY